MGLKLSSKAAYQQFGRSPEHLCADNLVSVATYDLHGYRPLLFPRGFTYLTLDLRHVSHAAFMFFLGGGSSCCCGPGAPLPGLSPSGETSACAGLGRIVRCGAGIAIAAWVILIAHRGWWMLEVDPYF